MNASHSSRLRRMAPYILVGVAGAFLFYTATQFEFYRRTGVLGPDFWPKLILVLLVIVCVYEIARIALAQSPDDGTAGILENIAQGVDTAPAPEFSPPQNQPLRLISGMAATLAYVALVATTGFFLTTAVYIAAFLLIGGYRKTKIIVAMSVGGALLLMFIFMKLVYVSLPIGSGLFGQLTILLMKLMGIR
ncbi:MAG: tripartite tricarboxylate transporter TctB family protein [Betaproteobacteria bacterium]|jgi:putative tricarboxylic transport membrane protein|nr:tripartite tricarboxylate transporter TctB family protein [Betaproteobacteria bacterium]MDH4292702.1 tripartite tricarboxylate transporter TctB family protein [Betaproteobacteria bacterium]MDH5342004.1 tripartite tricarboxylate transporter TctB family protein [Betaproteobacteria bacterium]